LTPVSTPKPRDTDALLSPRLREAVDKLVTLEEAAAALRTPVATLRYWRWQGTGPKSLKVGRRVLYRQSDLVAFIEQQASSTGGDAA
jgi:hypothetical protein